MNFSKKITRSDFIRYITAYNAVTRMLLWGKINAAALYPTLTIGGKSICGRNGW